MGPNNSIPTTTDMTNMMNWAIPDLIWMGDVQVDGTGGECGDRMGVQRSLSTRPPLTGRRPGDTLPSKTPLLSRRNRPSSMPTPASTPPHQLPEPIRSPAPMDRQWVMNMIDTTPTSTDCEGMMNLPPEGSQHRGADVDRGDWDDLVGDKQRTAQAHSDDQQGDAGDGRLTPMPSALSGRVDDDHNIGH